MDRFKFWKRAIGEPSSPVPATTVSKFNVTPRTDVGSAGLPSDPDKAVRVARLRKRREVVSHEVASAREAASDSNRWRAEISLIDQALAEIDADMRALPASEGPAGLQPAHLPIEIEAFSEQPILTLNLRIGNELFSFSEDLDWAERGYQIARSELHLDQGDVSSLAADLALQEHLIASLLVYATDVRDRLLDGDSAPRANLADLATPSEEFGGWLDWSGNSPFNQNRTLAIQPMLAERARLEHERESLIAEEAKTAESLPFALRRLAEIDAELKALSGPGN